jgi:hypothetical protein
MTAVFTRKRLAVEGYFSTPEPKTGILEIFQFKFLRIYRDLTINSSNEAQEENTANVSAHAMKAGENEGIDRSSTRSFPRH